MEFSIVIPTYNRSRHLQGLLASLAAMDIPQKLSWEVIVVDNNSNDDTPRVVLERAANGTLPLRYEFERRQGSSHARNNGIGLAKGSIVAFLDDDETVDQRWLRALAEGFQREGCAGIGGKIVAKWVTPVPDWYTLQGPYRIVGPTAEHNLGDHRRDYTLQDNLPATGNFALRRDRFAIHGCFRTDMGPVGGDYFLGEDAELCARLLKGGERLVYFPEAVVYNTVHHERLSKSYCRKYHFRFGRMLAQLSDQSPRFRRWGPVPRHLVREWMETMLKWIAFKISLHRRASFYYELRLGRIAGQAYEAICMELATNKKRDPQARRRHPGGIASR